MLSTAHRLLDGTPEKRPSKSTKQFKLIIHSEIIVTTYTICCPQVSPMYHMDNVI